MYSAFETTLTLHQHLPISEECPINDNNWSVPSGLFVRKERTLCPTPANYFSCVFYISVMSV